MAKSVATGEERIVVDMGSPNSDPQREYFRAREKYICYGGARGGGKTWCTTRKAPMMAYRYPGIRILAIRREYADMEDTIINPILSLLAPGTFSYNKADHKCTLTNGSYIKFGNMPDYNATVGGKYQGQEYDIVFIEEATQFLETEFRGIAATVRGTNGFPKRIYLTCNPGGVGHFWVKRLFVDGKFKKGENKKDYHFIKATVYDNKDLMRTNKDYVNQLENLPEDVRAAHLNGDWNALSGVYFPEFRDGVHTCKPFPIPRNWKRYRAMDYGLDCHFPIWAAVDEYGRTFVYRIYSEPDQTVQQAAATQLKLTRPDEKITYTIAPPDMWARNRESGKSQANSFAMCGVPLVKATDSRIQGWSAVKDMMVVKKWPDGKTLPSLVIFDTCATLIECVKCIQRDNKDPNDVAKNPHGITHGPDALRYLCVSFNLPAEPQQEEPEEIEEDTGVIDYMTAICGTGVSDSYIF